MGGSVQKPPRHLVVAALVGSGGWSEEGGLERYGYRGGLWAGRVCWPRKALPAGLHDNGGMSLNPQPRNPLHGVTLERMLTDLVDFYGWDGMARRIPLNCFRAEPSITSSLRLLRKTPWAREKVEALYVETLRRHGRGG